MAVIEANRVLSGGYGILYIDGVRVFEVEDLNADVEVVREDVIIGDSVDSKMVSKKGSGSFTVKKVYSTGLKKLHENLKSGKDFRSVIDQVIADPDAVGGQIEHISIPNVWFNKYTLANFKKSEVIKRTYDFGFTPTDAKFLEEIN